jgi:phospholipid/cholesterol/gamma-HCH transport system substrate-binding protein
MMRVIRKSARDFILVVILAAAAAGTAAYILANQRLRFPWEETPMTLKATMSTAQSVTPGQGQTVRIAGVRVGDIAKVELKNGRGIVTMDVDPEFRDVIHTDASALLRPKTGLKDMFIDLEPGSKSAPLAKSGFTIPIANTLPDINPDEVLGALDADTRDYLHLLVDGAGRGLDGQGSNLRELLRRFEPTHRDIALFTTKVAERRRNLRRLIHNLNVLNTELSTKDTEISQLIDSSARVFRAFAIEQSSITHAVDLLPGALHQTTTTLGKVERFARVLGPASKALVPLGPAINTANHKVVPLGHEGTPILRSQIRPFTRDAQPLVRALRPASANLATATPSLTRVFVALNHFFNMAAYNPNGREAAGTPGREEGYSWWASWLAHNGNAAFGTSDAHGVFRPVTLSGTCGTLKASVADNPELEFLEGLTGILTDTAICGGK